MQKLKPIILTLVAVAANAFAQTEFIESEPLPRPAESWQGPLFEEVGAQETGIDFTFHWDPPEHYKWHFDNAIGGGVAIGDYDADGLPDVFLTRAFGGGRLYRNLGNFGFRDVTASARLVDDGTWGTGASFVDLDNDGDLDLFVCSFDAPNRFYLNQGDGTFTERAKESGLDFKGASVMMAFADHDRDGDLDAYLLTNRYIPPTSEILSTRLVQEDGRSVVPGEFSELVGLIEKPDGSQKAIKIGQKDHFYRNNGDGTFTDTIDAAGISGTDMGLGVVWLDYDHDGWPDLYVSNDFYGADKLYHNNGNGTFTDVIAEAVGHTPWFSMGVDSADINNDGLLDLMASDMAATTHYKAKVNMGEMDEIRAEFHLDRSIPFQYAQWIGLNWFLSFDGRDRGLLQGSLGRSMEYRTSVNAVVGDRIILTVAVALATILFTWAIALPIGVYSAVRQYSWGDYFFTFIGFVGMSVPGFLFALVLVFASAKLFGVTSIGLFSSEFATQPEWSWPKVVDLLQHIWIPVVIIGVSGVASMLRVMRGNLLDELNKPYVVTARAKGVRPFKLLVKYPVRIALNPFISSVGYLFPHLISGGAIVAIVLSLPMVGPLILDAFLSEDLYLAGSMLMVLSLLGVFGTLVSDLLLMWLDPRIRMEGGQR